MAGGINRATEDAKQSLYKALFGYGFEVEIVSNPLNKMGAAKAILVGGNLLILKSMTGNFSEVNMNGKILFIERCRRGFVSCGSNDVYVKKN